jgi:hypothetical protein
MQMMTQGPKAVDPVVEVQDAAKENQLTSRPRLQVRRVGLLGGLLVLLLITGYCCYQYGKHYGESQPMATDVAITETQQLAVPLGATIIEQCAPGRGTQYILPIDIPHGPVYGVYQGKVIGLEYMIGKAELANNVNFYDLPLYDKIYNHMDIGLQSNGHAGFPVPHYHVDIHTDSSAASAAIKCK